jgi:hypothetical protein
MCLINQDGTFAKQVSVPIVPTDLFPCKVQKRRETFCNEPERCGMECYEISV